MARNIINRLNSLLFKIDYTIGYLFGNKFPPALCAIDLGNYLPQKNVQSHSFKSLQDVLKDGIMWAAVPKHRRTLERRLERRFGMKEYVWKPLVVKTHLLMCPTCGHDYEAGHICNHCYTRVKNETKEMQDGVIKNLGLVPVEKEVVVLYENEKLTKTTEFWKGQRIVELPKKRPAWYHFNLLQPTTQEPSASTDVKPTELA